MYRTHCVVVFAIAQLSCMLYKANVRFPYCFFSHFPYQDFLCCIFQSCRLHFHVLHFCATFSITAFSSPAFFFVSHFHVSQIQSPVWGKEQIMWQRTSPGDTVLTLMCNCALNDIYFKRSMKSTAQFIIPCPCPCRVCPPSGVFRWGGRSRASQWQISATFASHNKKLSYCWETVRRESMPRLLKWTWKWLPKWNDRQMYFKVINSGTNRKLMYDFLLVVYSNFCRITHSFWEFDVNQFNDLEISPRSSTVTSRKGCRVAMYLKCPEDSERKKWNDLTPLSRNPLNYLDKSCTARNYVPCDTFLSLSVYGYLWKFSISFVRKPERPTHRGLVAEPERDFNAKLPFKVIQGRRVAR